MSVRFLSDQRLFILTTPHSAYTFYLTKDHQLIHSYWGPNLPLLEDYPALSLNWQHSSPP